MGLGGRRARQSVPETAPVGDGLGGTTCLCCLKPWQWQQMEWEREALPVMTLWPSGLRRWLKAPLRKGVGSNPTAVTFRVCATTHLWQRRGSICLNVVLRARWTQRHHRTRAECRLQRSAVWLAKFRHRASIPGHINGNDVLYHWTTDAGARTRIRSAMIGPWTWWRTSGVLVANFPRGAGRPPGAAVSA